MQKITPCLWFESKALEAAEFYVSVFPDARIDKVMRATVDTPGPKAGEVLVVDFTLAGQRYQALNGGPHVTFNDAVSLSVSCKDQGEVDRLWAALTADGGRPVQCGWLKDKYGLSWQIIPVALARMLADEDATKAKRAMAAMMEMVKIDVAALQRAFDGEEPARPLPAAAATPMRSFVWYDLMTTDPEAAERFYRAVIGWGAQDSGGNAPDGYTLLTAGGAPVAGLMAIPKDARKGGVGPAWMGYIGIDDLDGEMTRVAAAGGAIHKGPVPIPGVGRFAVAGDPHGAGYILFERKAMPAAPPATPGTPGQIGWHELYAGDLAGAFDFYSRLYGWTKDRAVETPMGPYQLFAAGGPAIGGMMAKPPQVPRPGWLFYFTVAAMDAAIERITAAGGTILMGPMPVPGGSFIAQARDPQGAVFALTAAKR